MKPQCHNKQLVDAKKEVWQACPVFFSTLSSGVPAGSVQCATQRQKTKKHEQSSTFCRWYLGIFLPVFTVHPCDPRYRRPSSLSSPLFNSDSLPDSSERQTRPSIILHFLSELSKYKSHDRIYVYTIKGRVHSFFRRLKTAVPLRYIYLFLFNYFKANSYFV